MKIICEKCEKTSEPESLQDDSCCTHCGEYFAEQESSSCAVRSMSEYTGFLVTLIYFFAAGFYFYKALFVPEFFQPIFQANILVFRLALGGFTFIGGYRFYLRARRFL